MAAIHINSKKLKEMMENGKTFLVDWYPVSSAETAAAARNNLVLAGSSDS